MKISELAAASATSIPTIKFYIREGLLPPGESLSRTQASYTDVHLRRLDLIAILQAELGMSVERIGEVLRAAGQGGEAMLAQGLKNARESRTGANRSLGRATRNPSPPRGNPGRRQGDGTDAAASAASAALGSPEAARPDVASPEHARAWRLVRRTAKSLGWKLKPGGYVAADVAEAVATILRAMPEADIESSLIDYARSMKAIADREIPDSFDPAREPWESLRYAVLGTYLFEPLLLALRRLAHAERAAGLARGRSAAHHGRLRAPD